MTAYGYLPTCHCPQCDAPQEPRWPEPEPEPEPTPSASTYYPIRDPWDRPTPPEPAY